MPLGSGERRATVSIPAWWRHLVARLSFYYRSRLQAMRAFNAAWGGLHERVLLGPDSERLQMTFEGEETAQGRFVVYIARLPREEQPK